MRALSALVDEAARGAIEGLPAGSVPGGDEPLLDALARGFDPAAHLEEAGVLSYRGPKDARSVLKALMYEPVVNLNGISSGSLTGKTIVPHEASAVLDVRIPYGTEVERLVAGIDKCVARAAPEVMVGEVQVCPPSRTTAASPVARHGGVAARRRSATAGVALGPLVGTFLPLRGASRHPLRERRRGARRWRARGRRVRDHRGPGTEGEVRTYSDLNLDSPLMAAFHRAALDEGVYFAPRGFINTSTAMDERVIDDVLEACSRAMVRVAGIL